MNKIQCSLAVAMFAFGLTSWTSAQQDGTTISISPTSINLNGLTGTRLDQPVTIYNASTSSLIVTLSESTITPTATVIVPNAYGSLDFAPFIKKLRAQDIPRPLDSPDGSPLVYTTAATDTRGDNLLLGVDVLALQYRKRTTILGPVLDLRLTMISPDSNLAGFIHLDTDQDFGTGVWPTPWGFGLPGRDIGSEFEVLVDASGTIAESLGLGNAPIAILLRSADTTVVPFPLGLTLTRDSLFNVTVTGIPFGALGINDPDQNLNVGAVFARLEVTSVFPDFIPNVGHGRIGAEIGVPWMRQSQKNVTIPAGDSASVIVSVLAATSPGQHNAVLRFTAPGNPTIHMPVQMNVIGMNAILGLSATSFSDSLIPGTSSSLNLQISNTGNTPLIWLIADTAGTSWLSASPVFGVVDPGSSTQSTITMNATGLTPGNLYTSHLLIASNDDSAGTRMFPVSLTVQHSSGAESPNLHLPVSVRLHQNFPNPFNPSTVIRFELPESGNVFLGIFDILGREVSVLANGRLSAGLHTLQFEASGLASGVYFCRLMAAGTTLTLPMMLHR